MAHDYVQQDLFEGEYSGKKTRKVPVFANYQKRSLLPYVKIPAEHLVVAVIGVLVMALLSYAVGVEVGRKTIPEDDTVAGRAAREAVPGDDTGYASVKESVNSDEGPEVPTAGNGPVTQAEHKEEAVPKRSSSDRVPSMEKETSVPGDIEEADEGDDAPEDDGAYIIQIASFRDRASADGLVSDLKGQGLAARSRKSGSWYQVYAAGYENIVQARKARAELITQYADCYIKRKR
jgi:hypothetical protein